MLVKCVYAFTFDFARWLGLIPRVVFQARQHGVPLERVSVITVERHHGSDSGRVSQVHMTVIGFAWGATI